MKNDGTEFEDLATKLKLAWRELSVPSVEDVRGLEYEFGDYFMKCFAGLSVDMIDRKEVTCLAGMALVFMKPNASAYYLCVYLIFIVETLPTKIKGGLALDFFIFAQTYIALGDERFVTDVCVKFLPKKHLKLVVEFIDISLSYCDELGLDLEDVRRLNSSCDILRLVINRE
ncbi:hypothetical protein [Verrucomicrobium sp. BvORR034]|uniref:hypothetical protein n=1 Tax=Verrucomicrobium sp. BvORR034 TaxID=1396418 RepID=UPI00067858EB|nr:hypothetical protein [Verrucomicrobium sp. BvORR034]